MTSIVTITPGSNVTHRIFANVHAGVEHYADFGSFDEFSAASKQNHTTYLVCDVPLGNYRCTSA